MFRSIGNTKAYLLIFALLASLSGFAQTPTTFTVIKVSGSVYSSALKRAVKNGDVIAASDQLKFDSQKTYMHVINPVQGLKTVRNIEGDSPRQLMELLQTFVNNKMLRSSRGAPEGYEKIKALFSHEKILILGDGRLTFKKNELSFESPAGVKAAYMSEGKTVEKTISDNEGFNLGKSFVFEDFEGSTIPSVVLIYYENLADRFFTPIELLGEFTPVYVEEKPVLAEVKFLIETLKASGTPSNNIETAVIEYLTGEYEAPLLPNLRNWLAKNNLTY